MLSNCSQEVVEEFSETASLERPEEFLKLVDVSAKEYIDLFFCNRNMYCGGSINRKILHSKNWIDLVANTNVASGVILAYKAMKNAGFKQRKKFGCTEDILFVIDIFKQCALLGIPKCFSSGILLIYLELCEGISVL
jgi:hypothetical protein